ncbi:MULTISPECIES: DUF930 domain-containing protein [unclassified Chelatococcus]|uniref:DUF930 domain-containing protein n=1 Tax=unclassified Chelatococcus TaxID=2638111 RepID=UPI001BCDE860|nr:MULTISPECIES: DUF930 domain-containing protein [unclassified Chelatococcus]MBS7695841.1 DUF930 domain-containing protein [Chelatococcus sp. YT9]MBX3555784.1 DUF930 domain-containing protein [Chelatococcus sp.]
MTKQLNGLMIAFASLTISGSATHAGSFERELLKQDPRTRAVWVCERLGLQKMKKDRSLRKPDRLFLDVPVNSASLSENILTGNGQIRDERGWTDLSFRCTVSADRLKAQALTYTLGKLTPWEVTSPKP